jgi:lactate 2-monooxygenase
MKKPFTFSALDRQKEIFMRGMGNQKPIVPVAFSALEAEAKRVLSEDNFASIAGGAGREQGLVNNTDAFSKWRIVPRMLNDVSEGDLSIELFGRKMDSPLMLAPVGVLEIAHKKGDIAVAQAAARMNTPLIISSQASYTTEEITANMGGAPRWFQLYWGKSDALMESFVERAENAVCEAIVLTVDTKLAGWRVRDLDLGYLPYLRGKGIAQYVSDPVFQQLIHEPLSSPIQKPQPSPGAMATLMALNWKYEGNFFKNLFSGLPLKAVRKFVDIFTNTALNWEDLFKLRESTKLPILIKGILHPQDAQKALDHGIDGIIVSNHGGRQVDHNIAAIEALPDIVKVADGKVPVIMDSGIRSGADMFIAMALGASAVCIGRPYVYGLALKGAAGVEEVIKNMLAEFELTMRLSGCTRVGEITKELLKGGG